MPANMKVENKPFWKRVFARITADVSPEIVLGVDDVEVIQEHNFGDQDANTVMAKFVQDGQCYSVEVEWIPTQDSIEEVRCVPVEMPNPVVI